MGGISLQGKVQLLAFCLFEGCVGVFWPSMMALRARFVPEELRSTIINIFRIPLNLFVCLILYEVSSFPLSVMFGLCVVFLLVCVYCQLALNRLIDAAPADNHHHHHPPQSLSSSPHGSSGGAEESKLMEGKSLAAVGGGPAARPVAGHVRGGSH